MNKRINITIPQETLWLLDQVAARGERSRFIAAAVQFYAQELKRSKLKQQLQEGAIRRANRDLQLAQDWFPLDDELWQGPAK